MIATPDVPFIALATLSCVLMIGLGFLPHPSRATVLWSFAFVLGMLASYAFLAAEMRDSELFRALGAGIFLPANAYLWTGLRAAAGRPRTLWQVAAGYLVASPAVLIATADTELYSAVFRIDFAVAAVFACLIIVELVRLYDTYRDALLPLITGSAIFTVFAGYGLIDGILRAVESAPTADDLSSLRSVNGVGTGAYIVCAVVTLLLITRHPRDTATGAVGAAFDDVARSRLERARDADDEWWSLIDVRLDDPSDIRAALGETVFEGIVTRYRRDVLAALPADADIEEVDSTHFVALIPRSHEAVRRLIASMLQRISAPDPDQDERLSVRVSASIGWAPVQVIGHDLDTLRKAAEEANAIARAQGGDRWERTTRPCTVERAEITGESTARS